MRLINPCLALAIAAAAAVPVLVSAQRGVTSTPAGPIEVLIIRHGEEPAGGPHLDEKGQARAKALVGYFNDPFSAPTSLFAAKSSKQSARAVETLMPLSKALEIPIDSRFTDQQYQQLANTVLHGSRHDGGHVLICWHHETIRELAAALGVTDPPKWPSNQYDHVWRIRYAKGKKVTFTDEAQGLLTGIK
jgi:phosphohistidine phosphatase SixA